MWSFVRCLELLIVFCVVLLQPPLYSEDSDFVTVSATLRISDAPDEIVAQLKREAILKWLEKNIDKGKIGQFYKTITPDQAEQFILEYQRKNIAGPPPQIEIRARVDSEALQRRFMVAEVKQRGGFKAAYVFSSQLPWLSVNAMDTASRFRDSILVQAFYTQLNTLLNEYKVKFDVVDLKNLYLSVPVKQPDEIRSFAESLLRLGYPSALWIHITPCVNCGGARAEIFFYNLSVSRLLLVKNEEMAMNASVISQKEPLKEIVKTALSPFNVEFEEAISSGRLFSYVYHLEVEELRSLEHLKRVEERITSLDLNRQPVLKSASKEGAEYEIKSLLGYDELERQLAQIPMDGAKVKIR